MSAPDKLSLVVFSGTYEKVHYALAMAAAAAATNVSATLFFTMGASSALLADGWRNLATEAPDTNPADVDADFRAKGIAGFDTLLAACSDLGVTIMVCEMGLRAQGLSSDQLRSDLQIAPGGIVTFLADASATGSMLFI